MFVSIIVPSRNRHASLGRTLGSIAQLRVGSNDVEVLIVDNGSVDQTRTTYESNRVATSGLEWRYFYEPMPGLLSGRHRGALEARGDICVFLDDDVRLDKDWLIAIVESFGDSQVVLVGGPSRPIFESSPSNWLADFFCEDHHGRHCADLSLMDGGERIKEVDPCYVWGLNFAIRRKTLFDLGGFHPDCIPKSLQRFQGDGETGLSLKVALAGFKAMYHPRASVQHEVPTSRMTVQYFEQHAYYQGVCDSYTEIRANRQCLRPTRTLRKQLGRIKRAVLKTIHEIKSSEIDRRVSLAYQAGYRFHREEVRRDPRLLEWVLREDYWDYQLPAGWEQYYTDVIPSPDQHSANIETWKRRQSDGQWRS